MILTQIKQKLQLINKEKFAGVLFVTVFLRFEVVQLCVRRDTLSFKLFVVYLLTIEMNQVPYTVDCHTEPEFQAESLNDIFLRDRPSLENLFPQVFGCSVKNAIISVSGDSSSGKTMFLYEIMARLLMLKNDSKKSQPEVLLFDVDKQFDIVKFSEVCLKFRSSESDEFLRLQLRKLNVISNCNSLNMNILVADLTNILKENNQISIVIFDSLGTFYYSDIATAIEQKQSLKKETFMTTHLKKFKLLSEKYGVSFAYAKPTFMETGRRESLATHHISLSPKSPNLFLMRVWTSDNLQDMLFTINCRGIEIVRDKIKVAKRKIKPEVDENLEESDE